MAVTPKKSAKKGTKAKKAAAASINEEHEAKEDVKQEDQDGDDYV